MKIHNSGHVSSLHGNLQVLPILLKVKIKILATSYQASRDLIFILPSVPFLNISSLISYYPVPYLLHSSHASLLSVPWTQPALVPLHLPFPRIPSLASFTSWLRCQFLSEAFLDHRIKISHHQHHFQLSFRPAVFCVMPSSSHIL